MSNITERKKLLKAMRMLSTQAIMMHQTVADNLHLSLTDYKCLDILARFGSMTAGKLTEKCGLTTGAVTGVIDRLERAGYAKRIDNPVDRRSVIVELAWDRKSVESYEKIMSPLEQKMSRLTAGYTNEELAFFTGFMEKIVEVLHQETMELSITDIS